LNNLGYICGPVDGIAGPRTQAAVSAYQAQAGLAVTGKIDDDLLQRLPKSHDKT
jgi:peptidoglycan hydrolase-like protein with peptidoglycan-binding domain